MAIAISALTSNRNVAIGSGLWVLACGGKANALGQGPARLIGLPVLTARVPAV